MKTNYTSFFIVYFFFFSFIVFGQQKAVYRGNNDIRILIPPLSSISRQLSNPVIQRKTYVNKKYWTNNYIKGKGLPRGYDPLISNRQRRNFRYPNIPFNTFMATNQGADPSDPTGAVGPNHYVMAYNWGFKIFDKQGNVLLNDTPLSTLFPGFTVDGDPIVLYDQFADRYLITCFDVTSNPNRLLVAISQTGDPMGVWVTYPFAIPGGTPDYPKYSIWSDGYYITLNKDGNSATTSQVIFVLERDKMILGLPNVQIQGFSLPGIVINTFYSPGGFNVIGDRLPPPGNAPIIYLQDDSWAGVSQDHLKIWNINVDWNNANNSTIALSQQLNTSAFNSNFTGFSNLPQPNGISIDALKETMMFMTNYRRFSNYNSVVCNFVVNTNGNGQAGIRWYELRQSADGQPWTIYQEGTYIDPTGHNTFAGSISMDWQGNIALGYTIVSSTQVPELKFTGRMATDPLNQMTRNAQTIISGGASFQNPRYGDYAQMTIDPVDDATFWFISEYFVSFGTTQNRIDQVANFMYGTPIIRDLGVTSINQPVSGNLTSNEQISVTIQNFGNTNIDNFQVGYSIDNAPTVIENYTGTIQAGSMANYVFSTPADLSIPGHTYTIRATSIFPNDVNISNDFSTIQVTNTTGGINNFENVDLVIKKVGEKHYYLELKDILSYKNNLFLNVYSIKGEQILKQKMKISADRYFYDLDLTNVSSGIYIIKIENNEGTITRKIIVK